MRDDRDREPAPDLPDQQDRRDLFNGGLAAAALAMLIPRDPAQAFQQRQHPLRPLENADPDRALSGESIPLWDDHPPQGGGPMGRETISASGSIRHIATASMTAYRAASANGAAFLVIAGGGYRHIEIGQEANPSAVWLNSLGITAFVLTYRLPLEGWEAGRLAPFQDAQRAMRLIKGHASSFGIDPAKVAVLGFSAGGHLAGMLAARPRWETYPQRDRYDTLSHETALNALIYPVVTLNPPFQRTSTRRVLLGQSPSQSASADWSVQTHIHRGMAPFFLIQAADDPISNPAHTAILEAACQAQGVSVTRHLFESGGHGFGLGRPGTPPAAWPRMAEQWMRAQKFIP